jgi:hypothetical protein
MFRALVCPSSGVQYSGLPNESNNNFRTLHTASSPAPLDHTRQYQCWTAYAVVHYIILLMMGTLVPEACGAKEHCINSICVASSWFITLPNFTMHGNMNIKIIFSLVKYIYVHRGNSHRQEILGWFNICSNSIDSLVPAICCCRVGVFLGVAECRTEIFKKNKLNGYMM